MEKVRVLVIQHVLMLCSDFIEIYSDRSCVFIHQQCADFFESEFQKFLIFLHTLQQHKLSN